MGVLSVRLFTRGHPVTLMDEDLGENESKGPYGLLIHLP